MNLEDLKRDVLAANLELCRRGLALFAWGTGPAGAAHNAVVLEEVAQIAILSRAVGSPRPIARTLIDRHFLRKHGPGAYYGQDRPNHP